jgi:pilus assembly protein Flp/PilA
MAAQGIVRFIKDEQGLEMVEWAVVGTAIVVAAAASFLPLGTAVNNGIASLVGAVTSGS